MDDDYVPHKLVLERKTMDKIYDFNILNDGTLYKYMGNDTEVIIPVNVTDIWASAFSESHGIKHISIPSTVSEIAPYAFARLTDLETIEVDQNNPFYYSAGNCLIEKSSHSLLSGCKTSIIPDDATEILDGAFAGCTSLKFITIPDSITSIGNRAFEGCSALKSIIIPGSVRIIHEEAFKNCISLESLIIHDGVQHIEKNAFENCVVLQDICFPDSIETLGNSVFYNTKFMKEVAGKTTILGNHLIAADPNIKGEYIVPESIRFIERYAFKYNKNLTKVSFPNGLKRIGYEAFKGCSALKEIVLPEGLEEISADAFAECSSLTKVTIPESVISIEDHAFEKCYSSLFIFPGEVKFKLRETQFEHFKGSVPKCRFYLPNVRITSIPKSMRLGAVLGLFNMLTNEIPEKTVEDYCKYLKKENSTYYPFLTGQDNVFIKLQVSKDHFVHLSLEGIDSDKMLHFFIDHKLIPLEDINSLLDTIKVDSLKVALLEYSNSFSDSVKNKLEREKETEFEKSIGMRQLTLADYKKIYTLIENNGSYEIKKYKGSDSELTIPEVIGKKAVKRIGDDAFRKCKTLRKVIIPSTVDYIGDYAFADNRYLKEIVLLNEQHVIIKTARYSSSDTTPFDNTAYIKDAKNFTDGVLYVGNHAVIAADEKINNNVKIRTGTIDIADQCFLNCKNLFSVSLPDSITNIGNRAFAYCSNLKEINLPDSILKIGNESFVYCKAIDNIHIPRSLIDIGTNTWFSPFGYCSGLKELIVEDGNPRYYSKDNCIIDKDTNTLIRGCSNSIIPKGIKRIGSHAFSGCFDLKSIIIPESVSKILDNAFSGCSALSEINIPESVDYIGDSCFYMCSSLSSIKLPNTINAIPNFAFQGCSDLKCFHLPNNVLSIGRQAFSYCERLEGILIPPSVNEIESNAFSHCPSLIELKVAEENPRYYSVDNCIIDKDTSTLIQGSKNSLIPDGVKIISDGAFEGCTDLKSISIPDSVSEIGYRAFADCSSLSEITIPMSVDILKSSAFSNCSSLTKAVLSKKFQYIPTFSDPFSGCSLVNKIYI